MRNDKLSYIFYLFLTVSASVLSFSKSIFFVKKLSPADFGLYSLVMTSYIFLIYIGSLGANEYMLKIGSMEFSHGEHGKVANLRSNALFYGVFATALVSVLLIVISSFFSDPQTFKVMIMSALIAVPAICYNVCDSFYRCTQRHIHFSLMLFAKSLLLIILAAIFINKYGLIAAIGAESLSFLFVFTAVAFMGLGEFKKTKVNKFVHEFKLMLKHGFLTMLVAMLRNGSILFERYFISFAIGLAVLGEYSFVMILYQMAILIGGVYTNIVGPKWLSSYAAKKDITALRNTIYKLSLGVLGLAVVVYPLFYFLFPIVLKHFFAHYDSPEIFSMAQFIYLASSMYLVTSFFDWFFIALSKEKIILIISSISFVAIIIMFSACHYYQLGIYSYIIAFSIGRLIAASLTFLASFFLHRRHV